LALYIIICLPQKVIPANLHHLEKEAPIPKASIKIKIERKKEIEHHLTIKEKERHPMIDEEVHEKIMIQFLNQQSFL